MSGLSIGDKVEYLKILPDDDTEVWEPIGTVQTFVEDGDDVVVDLDRGFFSEDRKVFVSSLLVHPSNLRRAS